MSLIMPRINYSEKQDAQWGGCETQSRGTLKMSEVKNIFGRRDRRPLHLCKHLFCASIFLLSWCHLKALGIFACIFSVIVTLHGELCGFGEIMWSFLQLFLWQSSLVCGIRILIDWCCETPLPELFLWWIAEYLDDPQILSNKSFLILSCHDDRITLWCSLNLLKMPARWKWML